MKMSIVYHSESGNTRRIAEAMTAAGNAIPGIEVRAFDIVSTDDAYLKESSAILFGCPTYCGNMSWQMKKFLDTNTTGLQGKLGSAFATENYIGGGADAAELSILGCLLVHGMIVYTGGAMESPTTHFVAVTIKSGTDEQLERAKAFMHKIARKTRELFD